MLEQYNDLETELLLQSLENKILCINNNDK
jgi:hypothetical protein